MARTNAAGQPNERAAIATVFASEIGPHVSMLIFNAEHRITTWIVSVPRVTEDQGADEMRAEEILQRAWAGQ